MALRASDLRFLHNCVNKSESATVGRTRYPGACHWNKIWLSRSKAPGKPDLESQVDSLQRRPSKTRNS